MLFSQMEAFLYVFTLEFAGIPANLDYLLPSGCQDFLVAGRISIWQRSVPSILWWKATLFLLTLTQFDSWKALLGPSSWWWNPHHSETSTWYSQLLPDHPSNWWPHVLCTSFYESCLILVAIKLTRRVSKLGVLMADLPYTICHRESLPLSPPIIHPKVISEFHMNQPKTSYFQWREEAALPWHQMGPDLLSAKN